MTITRKIKIGKSFFHLFHHISYLSCEFENFWKKILIFFSKILKEIYFFFSRIEDNRLNWLASESSLQKSLLCFVCMESILPRASEASQLRNRKISYRKTKQIFFFSKFFYAEKQCSRQFWNAVEREPVILESSILPRAKRASSETT